MKLRRYWFEFDQSIATPHPIGTLLGCGVTAYSKDDAIELLRERVFKQLPMPTLRECDEDVDLAMLDTKHVLPNSGDPSTRGIWFPLGY